jgi:hypothetical protein
MKYSICTVALFLAIPLTSSARNNYTKLDFACLSIDGVPIPRDTQLATDCCSGDSLRSPPPPQCRVGFYGAGPSAVGDGLGAFAVAQNLLKDAAVMAGISSDLQNNQTNPSGSAVQGSQSSALISGGDSGIKGISGKSLAGIPGGGMGAAGAGGGGSASGMAGGGMGAAMGLSDSGAGKLKKPGSLQDDGNFQGGSYVGKAQGERGASNSGSGKVTPNDGSVDLLDVGNQGAAGAAGAGNGLAGGSGDELTGSREDAADYLSRIDRGLSIFKVVSKRYEREISRSRVQAVEIK